VNSVILPSEKDNIENEYIKVLKESKLKPKKVKIKDIKAGQYVLSLNEASGKLQPAKVNELVDMGNKTVYELRTESGRSINTTSNHPYLVKLYSKEECDKYSYFLEY